MGMIMNDTTASTALTTPGSASIDLHRLVEHAQEFQRSSRSRRTVVEYERDMKHFMSWVEVHGGQALPATPEIVALYATDCASRLGHRASTIRRRVTAVGVIHKLAGLDQPNRSPLVLDVLRGIARTLGTAPDQKKPVMVTDIKKMLRKLPNNRRGARDRTVLLLGLAGAFRRSELSSLDVADLTFTNEGLVINLKESKTDKLKAGTLVGIPHGSHESTCPVRSLQHYMQIAGVADGPLLRGIDRGDRVLPERLSPQGVARLIKKAVGSIGLDVRRFSGHSLRSGFATSAALNGSATHAIARQGRWKSNIVHSYIRHATVLVDNAAGNLGL